MQTEILEEDVTNHENESSNYEPPRIKTYTSEEILEQIGPAMACLSGDLPG